MGILDAAFENLKQSVTFGKTIKRKGQCVACIRYAQTNLISTEKRIFL
jgi:hypothetical protein